MAIFPRSLNSTHKGSTRVCCEFDWQSTTFEIIELDGIEHADGTCMFNADSVALADGVARFTLEGRTFALRPKCRIGKRSGMAGEACAELGEARLSELLTTRELQVVELVSTGLRNKQIAFQLKLSEYTVAAYVKQICHKLQVSNRTAMVYRFLQAQGQADYARSLG